jgi:hypothetical protein
MNSNQTNLAFEREIQNAANWLDGKVSDSCRYSAAVLQDRLMQRLVEIALRPCTNFVAALSKSGADCFPSAGTRIDCGRAHLELGSGRISVTLFQWLRNLAEFIVHWAYGLTAIAGLGRAREPDSPVVLVLGVGEESLFQGGSDSRFVSYCRAGPIAPLRVGGRYIVQSITRGACSTDKCFSYCRFPLVGLLREARIGLAGRLVMSVNHFALFFNYAFAALRFPTLSLVARDFAYGGISAEMARRGLIGALVLTGSNYTSQPLWTRVLPRSMVHMVWYSQSAKPISYRAGGIESDTPNLRWIRIGTLWLWTQALADYARRLIPETRIEVVGPILWYLPEMVSPPRDRIRIAIFDVPALTDDVALSVGLFPNYYRAAHLSSFLDDIIGLKAGLEERFHLPVSFVLKTKRQYHSTNDRSYFDYLEHLGLNGAITLVHYETNMYALISESHLVMAYPFSSPAYVADALGIPSIYYDPTDTIVRCDFRDPPSLIQFARNKAELRDLSVSELERVIDPEDGKPPGRASESQQIARPPLNGITL